MKRAADNVGGSGKEPGDNTGHTNKRPRSASPETKVETASGYELLLNRFPDFLWWLLDNQIAPEALWWLPEGDAIAINKQKFIDQLLVQQFRGNKFSSITRKLNRWGFRRIDEEERVPPGSMAYSHNLFRRDDPSLMKGMQKEEDRKRESVSLLDAQGSGTSSTRPGSSQQHSSSTASSVAGGALMAQQLRIHAQPIAGEASSSQGHHHPFIDPAWSLILPARPASRQSPAPAYGVAHPGVSRSGPVGLQRTHLRALEEALQLLPTATGQISASTQSGSSRLAASLTDYQQRNPGTFDAAYARLVSEQQQQPQGGQDVRQHLVQQHHQPVSESSVSRLLAAYNSSGQGLLQSTSLRNDNMSLLDTQLLLALQQQRRQATPPPASFSLTRETGSLLRGLLPSSLSSGLTAQAAASSAAGVASGGSDLANIPLLMSDRELLIFRLQQQQQQEQQLRQRQLLLQQQQQSQRGQSNITQFPLGGINTISLAEQLLLRERLLQLQQLQQNGPPQQQDEEHKERQP